MDSSRPEAAVANASETPKLPEAPRPAMGWRSSSAPVQTLSTTQNRLACFLDARE